MAPSTFRATVAEVAARAHERLPAAVNGRIALAVKLVLGHDVEPQADGSILVGSSSDPMKQYRLEGHTCTCSDFAHGKGIEGWCQHRIAAGIMKRVRELLPVEVPVEPWSDNDMEGPLPELEPDNDPEEVEMPPTQPAPAVPLPEAPASVNVHLLIAGRQVQLTLRDTDETRLLARLADVLAQYPLPAQPQALSQTPATPQEEPRYCPRHGTKMQLNQKENRTWHSHRTADGSWCKGK